MSKQIPVLYTEQKNKKVKIWLDGYLVPRGTLNSARLISAGKHEIDVVFYSSIDEVKPGREFETDRYLISVEESPNDNQPIPKPSFAVNDPTMKNRPKSAGFVPPRLVPKVERPPAAISTVERQHSCQWGYAEMPTTLKRHVDENLNESSYVSKIPKTTQFVPPTFQKYQNNQVENYESSSCKSKSSLSNYHEQQQESQPGLLNDALISRLLNNAPPEETKISPINRLPKISWSAWDDDKKSDSEDTGCSPIRTTNHAECNASKVPLSKQTYNWHSLVKSAGPVPHNGPPKKSIEEMPKFNFDDNSFDSLFDNLDE